MSHYFCDRCAIQDATCGVTDEEVEFDYEYAETDGSELKLPGDCVHGNAFEIQETIHYFDGIRAYVDVWAREHGIDTDKIHTVDLLIRGKYQLSLAYGDTYIGHWQSDCIANLEKMMKGKSYGRPLSDWMGAE